MRTIKAPVDRVLARVVTAGECLIWTGATSHKGYGSIGIGSRTDGTRAHALVHRVVWEYYNGPVPVGLELDHLCRNRSCVRLDHLESVDHTTNCGRADHSARVARLKGATHCKRNHEFTKANTRYSKTGGRQCRTCMAAHARAYRRGERLA